MTVRQRIDELVAAPPVGDLGYPADQRLVATLMVGLTVLADSIDELEGRLTRSGRPFEIVDPSEHPREMHDITAEIHDITEQVGKLAKVIKKASKQK
jgi:hypothetical protein